MWHFVEHLTLFSQNLQVMVASLGLLSNTFCFPDCHNLFFGFSMISSICLLTGFLHIVNNCSFKVLNYQQSGYVCLSLHSIRLLFLVLVDVAIFTVLFFSSISFAFSCNFFPNFNNNFELQLSHKQFVFTFSYGISFL